MILNLLQKYNFATEIKNWNLDSALSNNNSKIINFFYSILGRMKFELFKFRIWQNEVILLISEFIGF